MSKVIVFTCSPRRKGTTAALLKEVAKGAESKGAQIVEIDMNMSGVKGCQACNACAKPDAEPICIQNDPLKPMYKELAEADGIVVGSPIYMGGLTAQCWLLINRLRPVATSSPTFTPRIPGLNYATVITHANTEEGRYQEQVDYLQGQLARRGWNSVGSLVWAGADGEPSDELKQAAFAAGEKLVK